jgi:uncharacterized surface protein with fasciclin (FAS1) repeats
MDLRFFDAFQFSPPFKERFLRRGKTMKIAYFSKKIALSLAAIGLLTSAASVEAGKKKHSAHKMMSPKQNLVEIAASNPDFKTLVAAVKAADLVSTLSGPGPFTVFAPTDAAFAKLPAGTVETLVKPENKGMLTNILTYHVLPGNVTAKDVMMLVNKHGGKATVTTVQGGKLMVSKGAGGTLMLTDAQGMTSKIVATDVKAKNGVIHVIDTVVMP